MKKPEQIGACNRERLAPLTVHGLVVLQMKQRYLLLLLLAALVANPSLYGTRVQERTLEDLVAEADHVIVGKVTEVTMHGRFGRQVHDPESRTGPGLSNELRLHVQVEPNGVLRTNKKDFPEELVIPLWKMWHLSLGGMKYLEGETFIFLLKGRRMERVYPGYFRRPINEMDEVMVLLGESNEVSQSNAEPGDAENGGKPLGDERTP